jgi:hypothetical protein
MFYEETIFYYEKFWVFLNSLLRNAPKNFFLWAEDADVQSRRKNCVWAGQESIRYF